VVAAPGVVGGVVVEEHNGSADCRRFDPMFHQNYPYRVFHLLAGDVDVHLFMRRQKAHHLGEDMRYRLELPGP
jgi:hypothetical protein